MEPVSAADLDEDRPETPVGRQNREGQWAQPVDRLRVEGLPAQAVNLNVQGRQVLSPIRGFGQLWQKTYWLRFNGAQVTPEEVIRVWKANFTTFWPKGNTFYGPLASVEPGEVAVLNLAGPNNITLPGGRPVVSTGILVIYSDDTSFSFLTPEGHMFAAIITFSASEDDDGVTVAQIQAMLRPNDPLWELVFRLGPGHKTEDHLWHATLRNLAAYFGVQGEQAQQRVSLLDPAWQWREAGNIWQNAAVRTAIYWAMTPFRLAAGVLRRAPRPNAER